MGAGHPALSLPKFALLGVTNRATFILRETVIAMQKSLLVIFTLLALLLACERPSIYQPIPIEDEMNAIAFNEWVARARDTSGTYDTISGTVYAANGSTMDYQLNLRRQTATIRLKGKEITLPGEDLGARMRYQAAGYTLDISLDTLILRNQGRIDFLATLPSAFNVAYTAGGDTLHITYGHFDNLGRFALKGDTFYLREQIGLTYSQRYVRGSQNYLSIAGTTTLLIDGVKRFHGKGHPLQAPGVSCTGIARDAREIFKRVLNR